MCYDVGVDVFGDVEADADAAGVGVGVGVWDVREAGGV